MIVQGITSTTEAKGNDDEADVDHVAMYLCPVPHKKKGRNTRITQHTQFLCRIESYFGVSSRTWAASVGRVGIGVTAGKFNSVKSSQNSSHWLSLTVFLLCQCCRFTWSHEIVLDPWRRGCLYRLGSTEVFRLWRPNQNTGRRECDAIVHKQRKHGSFRIRFIRIRL